MPQTRTLLTPSEANERLILSLIAAGGANLGGLLGDHAPTAFGWFKIILSTVVVVAVTWRSFITNPSQTVTDVPAATAPEAPGPAPYDPSKPLTGGIVTSFTSTTTDAADKK